MKRIFGLILLLLALAGLGNMVYRFAQGGTTQPSGNAAYDRGRNAGRYTAPFVLISLGILGLRLLLQQEDTRPAPPPARRSPAGTLPQPVDPALRGAQDTFASNPARLRLGAGSWLAANPWVIAVAAGLAVMGLLVLLVKVPVGLILLITAAIVMFQQVRQAQQKFFMGDVCPALVISAQHNLVGVYTDLVAAGNLPHPAIKIVKQPLQRMTAEPAYDGMRVAAVATYFGDVRRPAWQDFMPEVIPCVISDPEEVARVFGSISEQQWQALDAYVAQVPVAVPGLYRMWNTASPAAGEAGFSPAKPWFKSTPAIIVFAVVGSIVGLLFTVTLLGAAFRALQVRKAAAPRNSFAPPSMPPQMQRPSPPPAAGPWQPTAAGPYTTGASVDAQWAGKWIPGKIVSINPGGFSMMVQLEDARFQHPILLSTNQLRLR